MSIMGITGIAWKASAVVIVAAALALAGGCKCRPSAITGTQSGTLTTATATTKDAAKDIGKAADTITAHTQRIDTAAPDLSAETKPILASVDDLRTVQGKLDATSIALGDESKRCKQLAEDLGKANARIKDLEDANNGLLYRLLTFGAVAGLGLAVVAGIWLRSWNAAVVGIGVFAACVAGQWLLAYRAAIAITAVSIAALTIVWKLVKERFAAQQLVTTVEAAKGTIADWDAFKAIANSVQGTYTRRLVNQVQKAIGVKKATKS